MCIVLYGVQYRDGQMRLEDLQIIASALSTGMNLLEEPTRNGGIIVDDETLTLASDMELVARDHFAGNFTRFNAEFLNEVRRANSNGDDPIEEVRLWLLSFLPERPISH